MIEIVPNWHPIFVHFPLALLSVSVVFFLLAGLMRRHRWQRQWLTVAHWNLWVGTGFAVITGVTGWLAYNSVAHDDASHAAMTDHRNWAIATLVLFGVLAAWSTWSYVQAREIGTAFLVLAVVGLGTLASTGWRGGELVFRHGLGVMSLPSPSGDGHDHEHSAEPAQDASGTVAAPADASAPALQPSGGSAKKNVHVHKDGRVHEH